MNRYRIIAAGIVFLAFSFNVFSENVDWGATGHRTVGKIAEEYLNAKTKRKLKKLLNSQSLALVSTFGDEIKSDKRYNEFYPWHYVNLPLDANYQGSEKNPKGDLVKGIEKCKAVISDENSTDEEKVFYIKLLVHFMGDLHQPMHAGLREDKGGNDFQVRWFNSGTNLHAVWDSKMLNNYNMSYTELAKNVSKISKVQIKAIQKGTTEDWLNETHKHTKNVYTSVKKGEKLSYKYMYDNFGLVRSQLQIAGIRLAKVLNDLLS